MQRDDRKIRLKNNNNIGIPQSMQVKEIYMHTENTKETRDHNKGIIIMVKMYGFWVNSYHKTYTPKQS